MANGPKLGALLVMLIAKTVQIAPNAAAIPPPAIAPPAVGTLFTPFLSTHTNCCRSASHSRSMRSNSFSARSSASSASSLLTSSAVGCSVLGSCANSAAFARSNSASVSVPFQRSPSSFFSSSARLLGIMW